MAATEIYREKELLTQMAEGDERAFDALFAIYRDRVYRYLLKLTHSPEVAEEIVIDIFMKLWLGRSLLGMVTELEPFLMTVARNKGIDFLRTASRHARLLETYQAHFEAAADKGADEMLIDAELRDVILRAVNQLPPQQRTIYRMRNEQGLSYLEIAAALGLSSNTVRNHLNAANRSMTDALKRQLPGDAALVCIFLLL